jgi:hypothetical protein
MAQIPVCAGGRARNTQKLISHFGNLNQLVEFMVIYANIRNINFVFVVNCTVCDSKFHYQHLQM